MDKKSLNSLSNHAAKHLIEKTALVQNEPSLGGFQYLSPSLSIEELYDTEFLESTSKGKLIGEEIINKGMFDVDEIYSYPRFELDKMPREEYDFLLQDVRRNNYGNGADPREASAYIAAGVVAVIGAKKAHSIIAKKMADGRTINLDYIPPLQPPPGPTVPGWVDSLPPDFTKMVFDKVEPVLRSEFGTGKF